LRRKQSEKLTAIAAAALAIFTRDGFAAAQVADIAREAGFSVGTLYLYADSKQALFELAVRTAAPAPTSISLPCRCMPAGWK
jgi:AcrR family transcriptional regulator